MRRAARVRTFPWEALPSTSRAAVRSARALRRAMERGIDPSRIAGAAADVIGSPVELVVRDTTAGDHAPAGAGARVAFELADGSLSVELRLDADLATSVVGHVLGRATPLAAPDAPLDAALVGALGGVLAEIARRAGTDVPLAWRDAGAARAGPGLAVGVAVRLDERLYAASAWITGTELPAGDDTDRADLAALGALEIALPLVVARAVIAREELAALAPGDAFMPGAGWTIDARGHGRGALAAPGAELGRGVELGQDGSIVLRDDAVALGADATVGEDMTTADDTGIDDAVLDAPIVVRVELGAISLPARDWARLRAGDVIETGRAIGEPVVLRVAGREVARGELVSVEGELGVRIREIAGTDAG